MKINQNKKGLSITNKGIALITLFILVISTISGAIAYTVGVKVSVENLDEDISSIEQSLNEIEPKIYNNEKDIAVIKQHYESIDLNIQEIKEVLKEI